MADLEAPLEVSDSPWTWLAIYAESYHLNDRAYLSASKELERAIAAGESRARTYSLRMHVDNLRARRKEAYSSLVSAVMACEAERLGEVPPAA